MKQIIKILFVFCVLTTSCKQVSNYEIIAHAGGSIDGYTYTNCLEAVNHAIACGINVIELDLILTSDSDLVAAHDWKMFHAMTGYDGDTAAIKTAEFKQRKIYGKYTTITKDMIDSIMTAHPEIILMTDRISDPAILSHFEHRNRILVEAKTLNDYYTLDTMGFKQIFYSDSPLSYPKVLKKLVKRLLNMPNSRIPANYTFCMLGLGMGDNTPAYWCAYGKSFAVFTAENKHAADSIAALDKRIKYVYVNNVE